MSDWVKVKKEDLSYFVDIGGEDEIELCLNDAIRPLILLDRGNVYLEIKVSDVIDLLKQYGYHVKGGPNK